MAFSDDFLRADAGTLGANWTVAEGNNWNILSNKAVMGTLFAYEAIVHTGTHPNDQFAQVDTSAVTLNNPQAGLVLRCTSNTYYYLRIAKSGSFAAIDLYKRIAGADSILHTFSSVTYALDTVYTLKVAVAGAVFEAFVGGVSLGTYDEGTASIASGSPGMFGIGSNAGTPTYDNFSSTDVSGGATSWGGLLSATANRLVVAP